MEKMKKYIKARFITVPSDARNGTIMVDTVGRNDPCPCGSGKKAKNCCKRYKQYFYNKKRCEP